LRVNVGVRARARGRRGCRVGNDGGWDLTSETVAGGAEARDAGGLQAGDRLVEDGPQALGGVLGLPRLAVEAGLRAGVGGERVALEVVGHDGVEAVARKVVRNELCRVRQQRTTAKKEERRRGGLALLFCARPKTSVRKRTALSAAWTPVGLET
jgi:hypothetical protein